MMIPSKPFFTAVTRRFASSTTLPKVDTKALAQTGATVVNKGLGLMKPVLHYSQIGWHVLQTVARHQRLGLPNFGEAQVGLGNFFTAFQSGAWRKVTLGQAGSLLLEGVKIYGFFLFGEMIGRGSVVGYQIPGTETGGHH